MSISGQPGDVHLDLTAVRGWLDLLHGSSPGLISIVSTLNWSGEFFELSTQADKAAEHVRWLDLQGAQGIYLRTTTLNGKPGLDADGRQKRGDDDDSLALPGFAGDIDIAGPGHKTKHLLPPDIPTAQAIVRETSLPEPTLWVFSGGGIYPWWLLEEFSDVSSAGRRVRHRELGDGIQEVLKRSAKRLGWHYGGEVGDLSRVLRIPGTVNRKAGGAVQAEVMQPASYDFFTFAQLMEAVNASLAALPQEKPEVIREPVKLSPGGERRVGDDFELRTDWADILMPNGFEYVTHRGPARMWLRTGSESGARWSASTGRANDRDRLYLFTPMVAGFDANKPYTKFAAYTIFEHGGDFRAATKALAARGFGTAKPVSVRTDVRDLIAPDEPVLSGEIEPVLSAPVAPAGVVAQAAVVMPRWGLPDCQDDTVAEYAKAYVGSDFRFNTERKAWFAFDGGLWDQDHLFAADRALGRAAKAIIQRGEEASMENEKEGQRIIKFGASYLNDGKRKAVLNRMAALEGVAVRDAMFDAPQHHHLVTLGNGVFNLNTGELGPFDRDKLLTRKMGVSFKPNAVAPQFEKFMEQLLPDAGLREYVQRAMGYTLAGQVDHRAIFLLYGPPKTGKSQFLKLMEMIFGSFGGTAASDTLRVTQSTQSNNLHGLKGKRFISTSETSVDTRLDEELIKRLTGGDRIVSRDLYEKNQEWQPECTIFMATNDLPRLSVDDSAIWTRVKPIPFFTQFSKDGEHKEIHNIAQKLFKEEGAGILNWLLAGLAAFRRDGLGEPAAVTASIAQHKQESDVVATFLADAFDESILYEDVDAKISSSQLFAIYQAWSIRQGMRHPIGLRRFVDRMRSLGYVRVKDGVQHWRGLKLGAAGMMGAM